MYPRRMQPSLIGDTGGKDAEHLCPSSEQLLAISPCACLSCVRMTTAHVPKVESVDRIIQSFTLQLCGEASR